MSYRAILPRADRLINILLVTWCGYPEFGVNQMLVIAQALLPGRSSAGNIVAQKSTSGSYTLAVHRHLAALCR